MRDGYCKRREIAVVDPKRRRMYVSSLEISSSHDIDEANSRRRGGFRSERVLVAPTDALYHSDAFRTLSRLSSACFSVVSLLYLKSIVCSVFHIEPSIFPNPFGRLVRVWPYSQHGIIDQFALTHSFSLFSLLFFPRSTRTTRATFTRLFVE